ncbi:class I SAM-dependent methyltransferase [Kordiimonas pumila]|uniref:Class I SAM-dependent methyltransferase n=1 Tax=Kordiimonas pumila TaxID=2161677 RepID=A0ABV7D544_9PROT|nr:methyltransferase domain-containing protein [Kordiimonas pumila]
MEFNPADNMVGSFTKNDGTIDFYLRVNSLLDSSYTVLDLGAGRAAWYEDDICETRRSVRLIKGKVHKVIAADIDEVVLNNRASDEQILIKGGELAIPPNSIDIIITDYVLEHIDDRNSFSKQIDLCLKSGGWFCARTPHKYSYVAICASLIKNKFHTAFLSRVQPNRKEIDVFPTKYKMNTLTDIHNTFADWESRSFIFRSDPAYYFGSKIIYIALSAIHRFLPAFVSGNLFVFIKKP